MKRRWTPTWGQAVLAGAASFVLTWALLNGATPDLAWSWAP